MINIADLLAAQARLQRDGADTTGQAHHEPGQDASPPSAPSGSTYPAKRLALENGQYRVVDHE